MRETFFIGVDVGTTGTKVVLLEREQGIVAQAHAESPLYSPGPAYAEADAEVWRANTLSGIARVMRETGVAPHDVRAIATTGMVPALVCLDERAQPLHRPILQNDARATAEIAELTPIVQADELLRTTGSALTQQSVAPTARWLQRHQPKVWAKTRYLVGSYDYVLIALGAPPHVEENWAIESGLFALDGSMYRPALTAAEIPPQMLPQVVRPGSVVGSLSGEIAAAVGLTGRTALVVGGADHVLSAYAAGVNSPGDWLVKLGGAGDILTSTDEPVVDARLYLDAHPTPGLWLPNGCMATSGTLVRWYQSLVGGVPLAELDREAADRAPAQVLCLPYFLGEKSPLHDPELRGAFLGLDIGHTRADLYRAVLEAIAFGFRHNADVMRSAGITLTRALVTNGGSKSTLWKQIHADVLATPLHPVRDHPGASLGAAILAGVGVDELELTDVDRFLKFDEPFEPNPRCRAAYEDAYRIWREASKVLTPVSHAAVRRQRDGQ